MARIAKWIRPCRKLFLALLSLSLVFAVAFAPRSQAQANTIFISSADSVLTLEAGRNAPRILRLGLPGAGAWKNQIPVSLIDHVEVAGHRQPVSWHFNRAASRIAPAFVQLVYDADTPRLRLYWQWRVRASHGPIEHSIRIWNRSGEELVLPLQDSVAFNWHIAPDQRLDQLWVEKGAGAPSSVGTHNLPIASGYTWTGTSSTYAHPRPDEAREIIPYLLVEHTGGAQTGWYLGIEFSGRTRISLARNNDSLQVTAGLNPAPGPFLTRVPAGGSFTTPAIFIGAFQGGSDAAGNILRRWVRQVLNNPVAVRNPSYPLLVNNSWGSGMTIDESQARRMIRDSSELGMEMFHLDAGWFRGVGDWYPDPVKFPHGIASVADYAHHLGLRFGLWVDWAQAGVDSQPGALNVHDSATRDWLTVQPPPGWKPEEFKGITIDIGDPPAHAWAAKEVNRLVEQNHLDMLEHDGYVVAQGCIRTDHPHMPRGSSRPPQYRDSGFIWAGGSNTTDVSYHATRAYYDTYSRLRQRHPGLLLEICNDGGRMVDFGSAAHGDYFSITDSYDPLSNRRAFYDSSHVLPAAMLESYVEKWPAPRIENFRYVLRSGMMGWFTLMLDTTAWTPQQRAAAREGFALYKSRLRPLIRNADLYHVSPRPDGIHWDGIEYFDPARRDGVLFAFHGTQPQEKTHRFALRGLRADRLYRLTFQDHTSAGQTISGRELAGHGVTVSLPVPNSSELVFLQEQSH